MTNYRILHLQQESRGIHRPFFGDKRLLERLNQSILNVINNPKISLPKGWACPEANFIPTLFRSLSMRIKMKL
jgi:hypothetical protein